MTTPPRVEYARAVLDLADLDPDPILQFQRWFDHALASGVAEPDAMALATATPEGRPSARIVLLRGVDPRGFGFYTNYLSRKGQDLAANPFAALTFYWQPLEQQVRIEGTVERTSADESDAYFRTRPLASRIGACVSPQSQVIEDRDALEAAIAGFHDPDPPRPSHWGGFRVVPDLIEFWQGRPSRLHDRFRYTRSGTKWSISRLAP